MERPSAELSVAPSCVTEHCNAIHFIDYPWRQVPAMSVKVALARCAEVLLNHRRQLCRIAGHRAFGMAEAARALPVGAEVEDDVVGAQGVAGDAADPRQDDPA